MQISKKKAQQSARQIACWRAFLAIAGSDAGKVAMRVNKRTRTITIVRK